MAILSLTALSFSELPSSKFPPLSSISHSRAPLISSHIRRKSSNLVARSRRRPRRKNPSEPPGNDMSTAVQMPPAPRRWDEDHDRLLNSMGAGNRDMLTANNDGETSTSSKNALRKKKGHTNSIKLFGVDLSPDNIAVAMVYFVQGVLGLSRLAVIFYLKDDLRLDPAETAVVSGFSALPWLVKPLYGFISDSVPLFGYRRRSYLVLSGLLGALSW